METSTASEPIKENFTKTVEHYSQNRKLRRQFKKAYGVMLPPVNFPFTDKVSFTN